LTLIVSRKLNDKNIHIVSDTRVTNFHGIKRRSILAGALKSVIISPTRCLCFAGNVGRAHSAIRDIYAENLVNSEIDKLINYLVLINTEGDGDTDFLLCELALKSKIYIIKDNNYNEFDNGWIGDKSIFELYQQSYHGNTRFTIGERMIESMLKIVHSGAYKNVDSVGDHVIITMTTENGFKYCAYQIGFTVPICDGETSVKNDIEHGGYAESILVPEEAGIGAIAVHIFPGNIGLLYYPKIDTNVIIEKNVTTYEYIQIIKETTGIQFRGLDNNYITISRN
jgi:hypothetical protein